MTQFGNNLKTLRIARNMTQKDLAEQLNVSPQAISRWENGEVEPSLDAIEKISKIFSITIDDLFSKSNLQEEKVSQPIPESTPTVIETQNPIAEVKTENAPPLARAKKEETNSPVQNDTPLLGICEKCNEAIYKKNEIIRLTNPNGQKTVLCKKCHEKGLDIETKKNIYHLRHQRNMGFLWSSLAAIGVLVLAILLSNGFLLPILLLPVCTFFLVFSLVAENEFIEDILLPIAAFGIIRMPGVLFFVDDWGDIGFYFAVKILLGILSILLGIVVAFFVLIFALAVSPFTFLYSIITSYQEESTYKSTYGK